MLSEHDFVEIVRLFRLIGDPNDEDLPRRRGILAEGLARLVGADAYFWVISMSPGDPKRTMPVWFINGALENDLPGKIAPRRIVDKELCYTFLTSIKGQVRNSQSITSRRNFALTNESDQVRGDRHGMHADGPGEVLYSLRLLDQNGFSCLGMLRHEQKVPFGEREQALVRLIFQNVDWIHDLRSTGGAGKRAGRLTHRQREILMLLLRGKSRKSIAASLGLSEHTIVDYMRQIYQKVNVRSQSELLSHFITGSGVLRDVATPR